MSRAVIRSNSDSDSDSASADSTTGFANLANPADSAIISLVLLTSAVLLSLNLGSSAYPLLTYISYFPGSSNKTVLVFLTCLAVLRILYRPIKKQVRLRILT